MGSTVNDMAKSAVAELPEALQTIATRWLERLDATHGIANLPRELTAPLMRLVACSEFAANTAIREWDWFVEQRDSLLMPPDMQALNTLAQELAASDQVIDEVKQQFRRFRNRFMLHILWREVTGLANPGETLASLSALADRLLDAAAVHAQRQLVQRFGLVRDADGEPVPIVILGMGKLGGRELNFSSDIDLIFLYPGGGDSDGTRSLSAQEYFTRISRHIIALLDEQTADGFVFRIDTRLRPFGDSGPPVVSFAALESYLLQHGRDWERYAYVKARVVGPAPRSAVVDELYANLIRPFAYRRYLDFGVFESLRDMQALIAAEVRRRELADNIKLGAGGIRAIEFVVQSLQLVRGGSDKQVQGCELQVVLPRLVGRGGLQPEAATELLAAYTFLRRLENFIQAIRDQQTHDLPIDATDRSRLRLAMGYADWDALRADLDRHRGNVTCVFDEIAFRGQGQDTDDVLRNRLLESWDSGLSAVQWADFLRLENFTQAAELAEQLAAFSKSATALRIDSVSRQRLRRFMPALLLIVKESERPLRALARTLGIVEKILRRSAYLALLNENQPALARLVSLCERSAYIAEQIARHPVLLDELLDPRIHAAQPCRSEFDTELQQRLASGRNEDSEAQMELLSQFQRANLFHIAVADFNDSLPIMKVSDALTELAETIIDYALRVALRDLTNRHGEPTYVLDGAVHKAGFGIIAYGKLGGLELSYKSDLDLVFLHDSCGTKQMTNGDKPLENSMFFVRLVRRLVHFLTTRTRSGALYEIDTRLRPDGQSGLLVTSTDAFERYQEENAWTWEHQALLRARAVAGSPAVAAEFDRIRADTLTRRVRRDALRGDVASMRERMRQELDKSDTARFDLKQGQGGIGDIEFIVQYLVLQHAHEHERVIHYSDNIRQLEDLAATGCIGESVAAELQEIYRTYRLRLHRLTLNDKTPLVDAREFIAERQFVCKIWNTNLDDGEQSSRSQ